MIWKISHPLNPPSEISTISGWIKHESLRFWRVKGRERINFIKSIKERCKVGFHNNLKDPPPDHAFFRSKQHAYSTALTTSPVHSVCSILSIQILIVLNYTLEKTQFFTFDWETSVPVRDIGPRWGGSVPPLMVHMVKWI